jgi:cell division protein FtsA
MPKETLVAGLDIGSNQVCCVAGMLDEEQRQAKVLAGDIVLCHDGIKAGAVVDIQEASKAIERVFTDTEKLAGGQIDSVILSLRGDFIKPKAAKGVANVLRSEITHSAIEDALDNARESMKLEQEQEILQLIPKRFVLDGHLPTLNPIGMDAAYIEVDVHTLISSSVNLRNILKAASSIKTNYGDKIYSYIAASEVLARKEEKEAGCLIIDFGGYTTGLVQYFDGILQYSDEIPVGSEYITRDLMHRLRASYQEAAKVKIEQGAAFCPPDFQNREFEYIAADGVTMVKTDRHDVVENIIMPRMDQILYHIAGVIDKKSGIQSLPGSIILTGGGSRLEFITAAFEKYFEERPFVRVGIPLENRVLGPREIVANPSYSSAIGAIYSMFSNVYSFMPSKQSFGGANGVLNWLKEIF